MPIERYSDQFSAEDMEEVGRRLMDTIQSCGESLRGWAPADCPTEIVVDLINERDEVEAALRELLEACEKDCGVPSPDDGDDEAVGAGKDGDGAIKPMALTFGMLRRARAALDN